MTFPLRPLMLGAALFSAVVATTAQADEARYNQVSLRAEVSREIPRDRMQVMLYTESQGQDPAALANETTKTLNAALEQARKVTDVSVSLGNRNTYPVYEDQGRAISVWRERGELRLESADFAALSKLTGELLGNLKMGNLQFTIADGTRKQQEDALFKDAVAAFKARAQLATEALGGTGYRIVNLDLGTSGVPQPMPVLRMSAMKAAGDAVTPDVAPGTTTVEVSAGGTIEVLMP
ncbi:periplasmic/secreted protein [Pseudomonas oryzihabitans]|uniref:SIMPL domain-containing protein n=1 Tax=Pseudomonas rhizoryzae TaxID=2571129 RepID=UPI00073750AB|nr:SIMPL domain-containing protein [Pseudomonas rhizoryzae]KTS77993.1 periplasmic/secreted protein [Pseudomonas psychrotolerans]KTT36238.1 periplasmic/secreted protein [Pseudomonas psychrotolerans]KTT77481.1 periplasmic/secreted protein [Pseudomonas psychrotolerans]